jgi:predicted ATP-dependent endonuclease of OLD family
MRYTGFEIINFKGIQKVFFDFTRNPQSPVHILVGLNESGKTTILEALSFFYDNLQRKDELTLRANVANDVHDLIPKGKKDNFNDKIVIRCNILLDETDITQLNVDLKQFKTSVVSYKPEMKIAQLFEFSNSSFKERKNEWDVNISVKADTTNETVQLGPTHPAWIPAYSRIVNIFPSILYYPNFLFEFPDKIFLETSDTESKEQAFYRLVLQDVLDSLNNDLKLSTHIIDRSRSTKVSDKDALDSVLNKMGAQITKLIFDNKFTIFKSSIHNKQIIVTFPKEDATTKKLYVELKLKEGQDSYYIRERSLGFRWFFTFLLFTQFRVARTQVSKNLIFLFDEPASNLHQSAQQKLRLALGELTKQGTVSIIYTTHSHHLINPEWLESTYIVRNKALDYEDDEEFVSNMTDINIERYRSFVGNYPNLRSYFQPILDVLDYEPSDLENIPNVIMIEGKNDFYTLSYFQKVVINSVRVLNLLPGGGSGSLDNVIRLYYAWGKNFIILLDSDGEGIKQKERYRKVFGRIVENKIFTLEDVNSSWTKKSMESLFDKKERMEIQKKVFPNLTSYHKKNFNLAIQENLIKNQSVTIDDGTIKAFQTIISFLEEKLADSK